MNIRFPPQSITDVSFVVQWDAVINQSVDRYVVYWIDDSKPIQSVIVNETSCTVTGLTPNTTYTVTVAAANVFNCTGVASDGEEVTTIISISMDTTSTVNSLSSTNPTVSVNEKVTTFSMGTAPTIIGISKSPIITTVTTDSTVTDVINATVTKLVPTVNITITSTTTLVPTINATNPVSTAGKLMSIC